MNYFLKILRRNILMIKSRPIIDGKILISLSWQFVFWTYTNSELARFLFLFLLSLLDNENSSQF